MGRSLVVVEGHGEVEAVINLLSRLSEDLGHAGTVWTLGGRCNAIKKRARLEETCERLRAHRDCERVLLLQDDEDGCPAQDGPEVAEWLRQIALPMPVAVTFFYREYETLFLPCLARVAGKPLTGPRGVALPALAERARFDGDPQQRRDAKKILSGFFPRSAPYQPTTHQLALTRLIDFQVLRDSGLPCFGTLERALRFVLEAGGAGVYPPPAGVRA